MTPHQDLGDCSDAARDDEDPGGSSSDKSKVNPRSDEAVILTDLEQEENEGEEGLQDYRQTRIQDAQLQADLSGDDGDVATGEEDVDGLAADAYVEGSDDVGTMVNEGDTDEGGGETWWAGSADPVVTVKLVLEGNVGVITRAWPLHHTLKALRTELSNATQVPANFLQLSFRGRALGDNTTLKGVGIEANETVQVGVSSKRPHTHPLTLIAPATSPIPTPDVITVIVVDADGVEREVVVEVEWNGRRKPWLGGFRHKLSGAHYHNATTQTFALPRARPAQVTRGTQTVRTRPCGTQTNRSASTQTTSLHPLILTPETTTIITPMKYSPAFQYDMEKVAVLQRVIRGWLARRQLRQLRKEKSRLRAESSEESRIADKSRQSSQSSQQSDQRSHSPQQKQGWRDAVPMAELYSRLENWRKKQVSQINATLSGKSRRRALVALLDKETELLRSLEAHRSLRSARRRNAAITRFLQEVSRAQVWEVGGEAGGEVEVETPETQPVRNLAAIATALQQDANTQTRLQQLNALALTVEHFHPTRGDVAGTERTGQELVNLARRATHLLARGTTDARLKGLRKRLHTLIISYLHQVQGRDTSSVIAPRTIRAAGGKPVLATGHG